METGRHERSPLFDAYRQEFLASRMPGYARLGACVAIGINTAFIALDYVSFPAHFGTFFSLRLAMTAVFFGAYLTSDRYPRQAAWSICLSLGAAMLAMIFMTGGAVSHYFAGLMLLFLGMGVVLPLSGREAAAITGAILLPYLASPLFASGPVDWAVFRIYSVFLASAAAESVVSCIYLDRMRFKDFRQRRELQKARDHLEEIDRLKSRFTANIHHELRTPLTLTLAPIESMLGGEFGDISELQRQYLKTAEANALRLLRLINNLLDLAKLESQGLELQCSALEMPRLAREILDRVRPMAERKGIELGLECEPELPLIQADPEAVEKILVNLIGNSLKFTERGGRITIELESGGDQGGVILRVADTGIGIPEEQLRRVFDRFAQVDASNTRKHEGTGIGLSLCHELAELHGGHIWAESEGAGRGARISVWLPVGEASEPGDQRVLQTQDGKPLSAGRSLDALVTELDLDDGAAEESPASDSPGPGQGGADDAPDADEIAGAPVTATRDAPEIVVAEDNRDMRKLIEHLLGREYRVRTARNGREALELVRERAPSLVVTDVMMPEMSGTELCRELKSSADTSSIPVVLVTSKAERSMKIEGLELGADDYITKPFHARELLARVRSLVRVRLLQDQLEERNRNLQAANLRVESALTELKEAQMQLVQHERLVIVAELAAGVAHEANNPLNFAANANRALIQSLADIEDVLGAILGLESADASSIEASIEKMRRLCSEKDLGESVEMLHELTGIVDEGLERTARLIGNLQAFARPDGRTCETLDVRFGLESTLQLMSQSMRESGIEVEVEAAPDLPLLEGDSRTLNQVFLNLLKNARDAMEGRAGTIRVELDADDVALSVRIRDQGHGIPDEVRDTLFEPFRTTKRPGQGTGLGLSISRNIINGHGGELTLLETSEQGTTFELRLPLPDDDDLD